MPEVGDKKSTDNLFELFSTLLYIAILPECFGWRVDVISTHIPILRIEGNNIRRPIIRIE